MPEIKQEVKTYKIRYVCDSCGNGDLIDADKPAVVTPDESFRYEHRCNNCNERTFMDERYPRTSESIGPEIK